jgi:4-oxalocrotonate tautomerase
VTVLARRLSRAPSSRTKWGISPGNHMPLVQITMLTGRTIDQKRKLAQRITDAMVEEAAARREAVVVVFNEVPKESYASGGVLMADQGK